MKLIIQIPCFNESDTLPTTIAELPNAIDGVDEIEYLIINDGSSDDTAETARKIGVHHIVNHLNNKGLAKAFSTGIDACLKLGADIIVNTDADNQYCGADVAKLIAPILAGKAEIVIGERSIDSIEHFSTQKKRFQRFGSMIVRLASGTEIPDAPSGFRAYARNAAMRLNVINNYTYTLETIIQAGMNNTAIASVPVGTNAQTRKSRLFNSMWTYIRKSATVILRSLIMYSPMRFFCGVGVAFIILGLIFIIRFIVFVLTGGANGHIQSLVLAALSAMVGIQFVISGLQADIISANRKILEDIQSKVRELYYDS